MSQQVCQILLLHYHLLQDKLSIKNIVRNVILYSISSIIGIFSLFAGFFLLQAYVFLSEYYSTLPMEMFPHHRAKFLNQFIQFTHLFHQPQLSSMLFSPNPSGFLPPAISIPAHSSCSVSNTEYFT